MSILEDWLYEYPADFVLLVLASISLVMIVVCLITKSVEKYTTSEKYTPSVNEIEEAQESVEEGADTYIYPDGMFSVKWTPSDKYKPSANEIKEAQESVKEGADTYIYPDGMFSSKWTPKREKL